MSCVRWHTRARKPRSIYCTRPQEAGRKLWHVYNMELELRRSSVWTRHGLDVGSTWALGIGDGVETARTWNGYYVVPAIVPHLSCWRGGRWRLRHVSQPWRMCHRSGYTGTRNLCVAVLQPHLQKRVTSYKQSLPNMWKSTRGSRLQDHGTARRCFSSRASPRGGWRVVNESYPRTTLLIVEYVIEACKRSHLRSPYTLPISIHYRP